MRTIHLSLQPWRKFVSVRWLVSTWLLSFDQGGPDCCTAKQVMPLSPLQASVHSNGQAAVPGSLVPSQIRLKIPQEAGGNSITPASTMWALQSAPKCGWWGLFWRGWGAEQHTTLGVDPLVEHGKSHHCRQRWRAQGLVKLMLRNVHYVCSCLGRALTRGASILWGTSVSPHWHSQGYSSSAKRHCYLSFKQRDEDD